MGAVSLSGDSSRAELLRRLLPKLTERGLSIGDALQAAKEMMAVAQPGQADIQLGWTLLGDPALVVER